MVRAARSLVVLLAALFVVAATGPAFPAGAGSGAPTATAVWPRSGPIAGGTSLTISGSGFTGAVGVTVAGASAGFAVVSDTVVHVTVPPSPTGGLVVGAVTVTSLAGTSVATPLDTYTYRAGGATVMVPSYFNPGSAWTKLDAGHPPVDLAIINPNSGPGSSLNSSYAAQVTTSHGAGVDVIGYVHTSYGTRSLSTVEHEIAEYVSWYHVDGIFVDETSIDCATEASYYAPLYTFIHAQPGLDLTVLNPGEATSQCYMAAADVIAAFEGSPSDLAKAGPLASWTSAYPAGQFWGIVYGTSNATLASTLATLASDGFGDVYVTDQSLPNPYGALPTYWSQELTDTAATGPTTTTTSTTTTTTTSTTTVPTTTTSTTTTTTVPTTTTSTTSTTTVPTTTTSTTTTAPTTTSTSSTTTTTLATQPSAPQGLSATAANATATLNWSPPADSGSAPVTSYNIYRGTTAGGEATSPIATGLTATTYPDPSLSNYTTYYYEVTAVSSAGEGTRSAEVSARPHRNVVSDFDGDGTTDVGVFRPDVGGWYVNGQATTFLGLSGDIPVPGDYNGAGHAEQAVYRPSVGGWYIAGQAPVFFGLPGDIPVPGDYNGDGTTDIAVYRPSVGAWYIMINGVAQSPVFSGLPGDIPVPGDYNGDGTTDIAVFRPSVGGWYINGQRATPCSSDCPPMSPLPGDYNGDGKTDIAGCSARVRG